jgi:hypothetical protein
MPRNTAPPADAIGTATTSPTGASVFDRYHIVAPSDLRDAAHKLEISQREEQEALEKSGAIEFGQTSGRVAPELGHTPERPSSAPLPN